MTGLSKVNSSNLESGGSDLAFRRLQALLLPHAGGDREMVEILSLILLHDEQPALAAVTLALEASTPSKQTILNAIRSIVSAEEANQVCSNLFSQYVLESAIRSGDAHLKNFGVLCEHRLRPQLSTAYDMLTMGAYAPRANNGDALDGMARKSRGNTAMAAPSRFKPIGHAMQRFV